ncbi:hypothetical protein MSG28_001185 [Choristoneura fumiferana]|uniref:Uncharacterized protein n=1 Tax=Choristoneura fumiferana TaxID=7141 RepID=A0ACC0K4G0_CHOFU|nr:hypothetical protein MSG28_001185 [Choristoneura fumiferana]
MSVNNLSREGVSGEWRGAWLMLIRRVLVYYTSREAGVCTVDLRKTRCVALRLRSNATQRLLQHAHCAPPLCSRDYPTKLTPAHNYPRFHHH